MFYDLDNEPMLWNSTHRDVHPSPTSYDELRDKTWAYAAAIKAADPSAQTLGPVLWGWCAYLYSAVDGCSPGTDYSSHGNVNFVPWYLQQMQAYEQQTWSSDPGLSRFALLPPGKRRFLIHSRERGHASLAPAFDTFIVGPHLRGRELDQPGSRFDPAYESMGGE